MKSQRTPYGFIYGPVEISLACSDDKKGWVMVLLKTKKHPNGIQLNVTKTGKVRVHSESGEWLPEVKSGEAMS